VRRLRWCGYRTRWIWVSIIKLVEVRILLTTQVMISGTIVPIRTRTVSINIRVIRLLKTVWIISLLILGLVCSLKSLIWISITWNIWLKRR
jgi:hypothetical protein